MRHLIIAAVLLAGCYTDFITINGRTIMCTICGNMTMCNG